MHSHLYVFKETGVRISLREAFSQLAASHELSSLQIAAELWVERYLSYLNTCLNDRLDSALTQPSLTSSISAQLLQTLVDELSIALSDEVVVLVEPTALPMAHSAIEDSFKISPGLFEIRHSTSINLTSLVACLTRPEISLEPHAVITEATLRQLQSQDWQSAWQIHDRQGVMGWLIACPTSLATVNGKESLYLQTRSILVRRAIAQGMQAVQQAHLFQQISEQNHQLQAQNRELTQVNRLKSEFLANTSHEIRTPLCSILGFTHLLREQGYNSSNARHQEYLKIILSSGQHLLALINDILDLSKIEANQLDLQCETVEVASLCQTALKLVQEKANDKQLSLQLEISDAVTTIVADPLRLKQMLFNLLSNALKFTTRGTITLQVQIVDDHLNFTVWDTGTGISEEQQQLLFRPYTQLTNAAQGEGTGLGLALTQKLAELQGGWVKVQSQVSQGSRFTIGLPLTTPQAPEDPALQTPEVHPPSQQPPTADSQITTPRSFTPIGKDKRSVATRAYSVLLVEDNVYNARLLITYLCKLGYEVTWARNSSEMWQSLRQSLPALILMDIHLPGADGLVLTQQLQDQKKYRSIPVIVQTAMAMKGDRERCLAVGAIDYISKPIDLSILARMVAKYSGIESEPQETSRSD